MINITIQSNFKNFDNFITQIINDVQDLSDILVDVGVYLMRVIDLNFRAQGRPDRWQPTLRGGHILADTGRLRRSLTVTGGENIFQTGKNFVSTGSTVPYASIQNFGGIIRAKNAPYLVFQVNGRWYKKKQVTIPARPFLVVPDSDLDVCSEILKDGLIRKYA